ncbi:MAG: hypothetical protein IPL46_25695 [Saprospiraceae bacterium]|nr:hypothetical protein [Saprospiraceae bacterium]
MLNQPIIHPADRAKLHHYLLCLKRYGRQLALPGLSTLMFSLTEQPVQAQGPIGDELRVNSFINGNQFEQAIASDDLGNTVIAYTSQSLDGSGYGIYLKRYDHLGNQVQAETLVNTFTTGEQRAPAVAMDADGDFVVVWQSENQASGTSGLDIYGRRYNSNGMAQGVEYLVNTFTTGNQVTPSVAMDDSGNFVVVWGSKDQEGMGSDYGIYAQRYSSVGALAGVEFRINQVTSDDQQTPDIAMNGDGDFVVVWQSRDQEGAASGLGIYGRKYNATGVAQVSELLINTVTTSNQSQPAVSLEKNGDFVIVWQSQNEDNSGTAVMARRYQANTVALGGAFLVNSYTTSAQANPDVALDADGDFTVVWQSYGQDGNKNGVYGQRYSRDGNVLGEEFQIHRFTTEGQSFPSVTIDSDGDFLVSWVSFNQEGVNSGYGVYFQRFCPGRGGEQRVNSFVSGAQSDPDIAMDATGNYVVVWSGEGNDGLGIYGRRFNKTGQALGMEFKVNSGTISGITPSVAMDHDGDFVVVWESSYQVDSGTEIYGQRYDALGVAQGAEFLVNTTTINNQQDPRVAMDYDGDFVVAWASTEGAFGYEIYGQRYNANGIKQGVEFLVNSYITNNQVGPVVAMDEGGNFVVVWTSVGQDGAGEGIFGRLFNAAGVAQGVIYKSTFILQGVRADPRSVWIRMGIL